MVSMPLPLCLRNSERTRKNTTLPLTHKARTHHRAIYMSLIGKLLAVEPAEGTEPHPPLGVPQA